MTPHGRYLRYLATFGIRRPGARVHDHASLALGPFRAFSLASATSGPYRALAAAQGLVAPGMRGDDAWFALLGAGSAAEVSGRVAWLESTEPHGPHRRASGLVALAPGARTPGTVDPRDAAAITSPALVSDGDGARVLTAWFARFGGDGLERWWIRATPGGPTAFDVRSVESRPPDRDALERARALLGSAHAAERLWATTVLAAHPETAAADALLPLLADGDADVREAAATALGRIAAPSAIGPLVEAFARHDDDGERRHLVQVLASFGDAAVTGLSELSARDAGADVRLEIVHALGRIATPAARAPLSRLATDDDAGVRALARTYLQVAG